MEGSVGTHGPLHSNGGGGEDGGIVEVDNNIPQLSLDLTMFHSLTGWRNVCMHTFEILVST